MAKKAFGTMIPQHLVDFIQGPHAMAFGSRNGKLLPCGTLAFGGVVDAERETVTVFVPNAMAAETLENMEDNGQIALAVGHGEMHESYQFKGAYISSRPSTPHETAIQDIYKTKLVTHFRAELGDLADRYWGQFDYHPSTAISFKVTEIFDQTPGPDAGRKIEF